MTNENDGYGELEPLRHILMSKDFWPSLVIEMRRAPEAAGYQEMAVTPLDWMDEVPDVIVLESSVDVDEYLTADGRTVHVYRSTDPERRPEADR